MKTALAIFLAAALAGCGNSDGDSGDGAGLTVTRLAGTGAVNLDVHLTTADHFSLPALATSPGGAWILSAGFTGWAQIGADQLVGRGTGGQGFVFAAFQPDGTPIWAQTYQTGGDLGEFRMSLRDDGEAVVGGLLGGSAALGRDAALTSIDAADALVMAFDQSGQVRWMRSLATDPQGTSSGLPEVTSVIALPGGGAVVAGFVLGWADFGNGPVQAIQSPMGYIAQYDETGALTRLYTNADVLPASSVDDVAIDGDGDLTLVGNFGDEIVLEELDPRANVVWSQVVAGVPPAPRSGQTADDFSQFSVDSFGNVALSVRCGTDPAGNPCGPLSPSGDYARLIAFFTPGGVMQWSTSLNVSEASVSLDGAGIDIGVKVTGTYRTSLDLGGEPDDTLTGDAVGEIFTASYDRRGTMLSAMNAAKVLEPDLSVTPHVVDGSGQLFLVGLTSAPQP